MSERGSSRRARTPLWPLCLAALAGCNALFGIDEATTPPPDDPPEGGAAGFGGEGLGGQGGDKAAAGSGGSAGAGGQAGSAPLPAVVEIVAGGQSACARLDDGSLRCWGRNRYGQLGLGHTGTIGNNESPSSARPVDLGAKVTGVAVGEFHACATLEGGSLRCWGSRSSGELGLGHLDNDLGDNEPPTQGPAIRFDAAAIQISVGQHHTCALLEGGAVHCWGDNAFGQLGYGNTTNLGDDEPAAGVPPVNLGGKASRVAAGGSHTCALLDDGSVRCWGYNVYGQLGLGHVDAFGDAEGETPSALAAVNLGQKATQIVAGRFHTCALLEGGAVRCWGYNAYGQLGLGHAENVGDAEGETPAAVAPVALDRAAAQIVAGGNFTCALLEGGAVRCWGYNAHGQLGYGNSQPVGDNETPTQVAAVEAGGAALQLVAGDEHACALLEGGAVRCWGYNAYGQLGLYDIRNIGDDELPNKAPPVQIVAAPGAGGRGGGAPSCETPTQFEQVKDCASGEKCASGVVECGDTASCEVKCSDANSCENSTIRCPRDGDCRVACTGEGSCQGANILCGSGACEVVCDGPGGLLFQGPCAGMADVDCSGSRGPCTVTYHSSGIGLPPGLLGCEPGFHDCACELIEAPSTLSPEGPPPAPR